MIVYCVQYSLFHIKSLLEYPTHCSKYNGPNSLKCFETMWINAHCIKEGNAFPAKLSITEMTRLESMNLKYEYDQYDEGACGNVMAQILFQGDYY